ncbi:MAG: hypothetical protein PVG90_02835 [Bacillota bacterium]|jgi:hypothetical protein
MRNRVEHYPKLYLYLLAGVAALPGGPAPAAHEVRRQLHRILISDPLLRRAPHFDWERYLNWDLMNAVADFLRNPLLILTTLALIWIFCFVLRNLTPYLRGAGLVGGAGRKASAKSGVTAVGDEFTACYHEALREAAAGRYRKALIALHKATVVYVLTQTMIIAPGKKYTNNDLKRKLAAKQTLYHPFALISQYAEIASFSRNEISRADFNQSLAVFEKYFL